MIQGELIQPGLSGMKLHCEIDGQLHKINLPSKSVPLTLNGRPANFADLKTKTEQRCGDNLRIFGLSKNEHRHDRADGVEGPALIGTPNKIVATR